MGVCITSFLRKKRPSVTISQHIRQRLVLSAYKNEGIASTDSIGSKNMTTRGGLTGRAQLAG